MENQLDIPLSARLLRFALTLGLTLLLIYGLLPALTRSVPILHTMAGYLEHNGIDPTRYYYTDVEQVKEGERYIANAIGRGKG